MQVQEQLVADVGALQARAGGLGTADRLVCEGWAQSVRVFVTEFSGVPRATPHRSGVGCGSELEL